MDHVISSSIIENKPVDDVVESKLEFDNSSLVRPIKYPQPVAIFSLIKSKIYIEKHMLLY